MEFVKLFKELTDLAASPTLLITLQIKHSTFIYYIFNKLQNNLRDDLFRI